METLDQELHQLTEAETRLTGQFELLSKQIEQAGQQLTQTRDRLTAYRWLKGWLNQKPQGEGEVNRSTLSLLASGQPTTMTMTIASGKPLSLLGQSPRQQQQQQLKTQPKALTTGAAKPAGRAKLTTRTITKVANKKLPSEWRLIRAYSQWIDFHARSNSGNRQEIKLPNGNGKSLRPFIPMATRYNPKLLCGCELSAIAFGF